jgi:hypothetical protein
MASGGDRVKSAKQKKPFKAPTLKRYGDVRSITEAVGATGKVDGGMQLMTKTAP